MARAALGYGGRFVWEAGRGDRRLRPLLEEAIRSLGERDTALRARLLARLAGGPLRAEPDRARRVALSEQAVEVARRLGCPATLAYTLDGRYTAMAHLDNLVERLGAASELVDVAGDAGDKERELQGRHYRCLALVELGDMPAAYVELEEQARLADELRQPAQQWYVASLRATLATFEGRFAEAERLVPEALAIGRHAQGSMATAYHAIQIYLLRREQGRLDELEPAVRATAADFATYPVLRCVLAHLQAELGRPEAARQLLEQLMPDRSSDPRMGGDCFGTCLLADVASFIGDDVRAAALYDALLPYRDRNALSPPAGCLGSVSRTLGLLAATLEPFREAERHFGDAIEMNGRSGAQPWVAWTRLDHGRVVLARGDEARAAELLGAALHEGRRLGSAGVEAAASEALASRPPSSEAEAGCVFRREGEYWAIGYEGDSFRLKHSKGLAYLAELLARPGTELHALALVAAAGGGQPGGGGRGGGDETFASSGVGDAGELLDREAREAYRRRIEELSEELDEAERFGDLERLARAREESEFLTAELAAAVGLGSRGRRAPGPAEWARQSVTKAIKAALRRIEEHSPALASHLAATVRTGAVCAYEPDPRAATNWRL